MSHPINAKAKSSNRKGSTNTTKPVNEKPNKTLNDLMKPKRKLIAKVQNNSSKNSKNLRLRSSNQMIRCTQNSTSLVLSD